MSNTSDSKHERSAALYDGELTLDLFYGELTDTLAKVYVRAAAVGLEGAHLTGTVRGPACELAQTLAFDVTLVPAPNAAEGDSALLAMATLPDPCPWTPELPMVYEVAVQVTGESGKLLFEAKRSLGLRPLGPRGKDLLLDGRRWVMRGARAKHIEGALESGNDTSADEIDAWREAHAICVVNNPSDAFCAAASRRGVMLVVMLDAEDRNQAEGQLRRLARWPAVGIVALPSKSPVEETIRQAAPNALLAEFVQAGDESVTTDHNVAAWADVVLCEGGAAAIGQLSLDRTIPLLGLRSSDQTYADVAEARAACDSFQAELAPFGDFAGYLL